MRRVSARMQSRRRSAELKLNEKSMRPVSGAPLSERGRARTGGCGTTWCKSSRVPRPRSQPEWRWALARIKIPRLCKFLGAEIPRRINTIRTASSSSKERGVELAFYITLRCREVVLASVECSASIREFSVSRSPRLMRELKTAEIKNYHGLLDSSVLRTLLKFPYFECFIIFNYIFDVNSAS